MDMAGTIREALEVVWEKSQNRQKEEQKPVPKWEPVLDPALTAKRSRFGAEITCDNDFWGVPSCEKKGAQNEHRIKCSGGTATASNHTPGQGVGGRVNPPN